MIRVLQLIGTEAEWEMAHQAGMLERASGGNFFVARKTIGRGGTWRNIPCAAAMLHRERDRYDLIHAWGAAALATAALGCNLPIVFSPPEKCDPAALRRLQLLQQRERVQALCPSEVRRRGLIEHGVWAGRCRLIRPGIERPAIREGQASAARRGVDSDHPNSLRARLGLSQDDYVLLAPGESTRSAGHVEALWAVSILHVADSKYKLLTWGRGAGASAVRNFAEKTGPQVLCEAESQLGERIEFEQLPAAADAVVWTARGSGGTLSAGMCMSAGLPIVAARSAITDELLVDGRSALMCDAQPRAIAQRILDLTGDGAPARSIAVHARLRAQELFQSGRFVSQVEDAYRRVLRLRSNAIS